MFLLSIVNHSCVVLFFVVVVVVVSNTFQFMTVCGFVYAFGCLFISGGRVLPSFIFFFSFFPPFSGHSSYTAK